MASIAVSFNQPLLMSICILYTLLLCIFAPLAASLSFSFNLSKPTPCPRGLVCEGGAFRNPMMDMTPWTYTTGRVSYAQPVRLWDAETGELASFTTTFSFSIYAAVDNKGIALMLGDGMTFFLGHYPASIPDNSWGGSLGLIDLTKNRNVVGDSRIVAVEFDTVGNPEFLDVLGSNHMGIDINSIVSMAYTNISNDLREEDVMTARISYDNVTQVLAADLRIRGTSYHVNTTVDLKNSLPEEVAVGFSASTGKNVEVNKILSWTFNSTTLTTTEKPTSGRRPTNKLLAAAIVPPAVFVGCVLLGFCLWRHKTKRRKHTVDEDSEPEEEDEFVRGMGPKRYGYRRLVDATGNFAERNKLGQGGFGSVYKGELTDQDCLVAVKMLSPESSGQGRKEFEAEVKIISQLRHRNLVRLLGWCDSHRGLLLVYECVAKGGLDRHIHGTGTCLTWRQRYNIILGLGSALRYLHEEVEQYVVHGDIKTSNIMLDSSYNAKLGDFGLARIVDPISAPHTTRVILGTPGYIDPEFVSTQRPSVESDIYSFGIVVLEIISGRRPKTKVGPDGEVNMLLEQVWDLYGDNTILKAADQRLVVGDELGKLQMERALVVGLWCALPIKSERPSIGQVLHVLACSDVPLPSLWPQMCNDNTSATENISEERRRQ